MTPKKLIQQLIEGGVSTSELSSYLNAIQVILDRANAYEAVQTIIAGLDLPELPLLENLVITLYQGGLLTTLGLTALIREVQSHSDEQIIVTSDPEMVDVEGDTTYVKTNRPGLDVRQGQRIYKRSLETDVSKLLA